MTDKVRIISVRSDEAGASVTFSFDGDAVPTEALAELFAEAIRDMLEKNPWEGMPPIQIALAWSLASVARAAADLVTESKHDNAAFRKIVCDTITGYYA